jgi:hypothetical protein
MNFIKVYYKIMRNSLWFKIILSIELLFFILNILNNVYFIGEEIYLIISYDLCFRIIDCILIDILVGGYIVFLMLSDIMTKY